MVGRRPTLGARTKYHKGTRTGRPRIALPYRKRRGTGRRGRGGGRGSNARVGASYKKLTMRRMPTYSVDKVKLPFITTFTVFLSNAEGKDVRGFTIFANSAFDPYRTLGVQQGRGLDQWAAFYRSYYVWACKITLIAVNTNAKATIAYLHMTDTDPGVTFDAVNDRVTELRHTVSRVLTGELDKVVLESYATTKKGSSGRNRFKFPSYSALLTADPTIAWFWECGIQTFSNSTAALDASVQFRVRLKQYCILFDRIQVAISDQ